MRVKTNVKRHIRKTRKGNRTIVKHHKRRIEKRPVKKYSKSYSRLIVKRRKVYSQRKAPGQDGLTNLERVEFARKAQEEGWKRGNDGFWYIQEEVEDPTMPDDKPATVMTERTTGTIEDVMKLLKEAPYKFDEEIVQKEQRTPLEEEYLKERNKLAEMENIIARYKLDTIGQIGGSTQEKGSTQSARGDKSVPAGVMRGLKINYGPKEDAGMSHVEAGKPQQASKVIPGNIPKEGAHVKDEPRQLFKEGPTEFRKKQYQDAVAQLPVIKEIVDSLREKVAIEQQLKEEEEAEKKHKQPSKPRQSKGKDYDFKEVSETERKVQEFEKKPDIKFRDTKEKDTDKNIPRPAKGGRSYATDIAKLMESQNLGDVEPKKDKKDKEEEFKD